MEINKNHTALVHFTHHTNENEETTGVLVILAECYGSDRVSHTKKYELRESESLVVAGHKIELSHGAYDQDINNGPLIVEAHVAAVFDQKYDRRDFD